MNTEKPIESHTAADFLQYAIDNPVLPPAEEDESENNFRGDGQDPSLPRRKAPRNDNQADTEPDHRSARDDKENHAAARKRADKGTDNNSDSDNDNELDARDDNGEELDSEDNDRDETDEGESLEDDDEIPQLDPLIEELAKGNPKAEKRVHEIAKGLEKLKTESKQLKQDLEQSKPRADAWDSYQRAFEDPINAGPTLQKLIEAVAEFHGGQVPGLGFQVPGVGRDMSGDETPRQDGGLKSALPQQHETITRLERELRAIKSAVQGFQRAQAELQQERAAARMQAEFKNYVDDIAPKTIRRLQTLENGWKVSKGMVERAIKEFPQLKNDPVRAVKAAFADELKSHYAKQASQARRVRGPEMLPDSRAKGESMKPPLQTTAADVYAMLE